MTHLWDFSSISMRIIHNEELKEKNQSLILPLFSELSQMFQLSFFPSVGTVLEW